MMIALVLSGIMTLKMPPKKSHAASHASIARAVVSSNVGYTNRHRDRTAVKIHARKRRRVLAAMTFTFLQFERHRRTDPLPTFPEIRDLMREVMAALLWTARPGWLKLAISFQRNPPLRI